MPDIQVGRSCPLCGKPFSLGAFHKCNSKLHTLNGYMVVCKECFSDNFDTYNVEYHDSKKAIKRICMAYGLYYSDSMYASSIDDDGVFSLAKFMRLHNMKPNKDKTFDDSLDEGFNFSGGGEHGIELGAVDEKPIEPRLLAKWGSGFQYDDYKLLDEHYKKLTKSNPKITENQGIFIDALCHTNMLMTKALKSLDLDGYAKASEQYRKTFQQAGLKTTQEVEIGSDDCWGEWVRRIEEYTPAEYYKDNTLFKDFDGIGDYFTRFVFRPLKNLILGTTERDKEFCVPEDSDGNDEPN